MSDLLELDLWVAVNSPTRALGAEFGSSGTEV